MTTRGRTGSVASRVNATVSAVRPGCTTKAGLFGAVTPISFILLQYVGPMRPIGTRPGPAVSGYGDLPWQKPPELKIVNNPCLSEPLQYVFGRGLVHIESSSFQLLGQSGASSLYSSRSASSSWATRPVSHAR